MKFYLDEDLSPKIAELLRKDGVDCISAHETEMTQVSDLEQLNSRLARSDAWLPETEITLFA